jgi:membrane protein implicated in regulation of membrane protease activity
LFIEPELLLFSGVIFPAELLFDSSSTIVIGVVVLLSPKTSGVVVPLSPPPVTTGVVVPLTVVLCMLGRLSVKSLYL